MRTLEQIDKDLQMAINKVAELASEREAIRPNPIKVMIDPNCVGIKVE
jgi:hypothetical protein